MTNTIERPFFTETSRPSLDELKKRGLTPRLTLLSRGARMTASQLQFRYTKHAQPGDDPNYRGIQDRNKVDRDVQYEAITFINGWCDAVGCDPSVDGRRIERALQQAPSGLVDRADLQWWVWDHLLPSSGGLLGNGSGLLTR